MNEALQQAIELVKGQTSVRTMTGEEIATMIRQITSEISSLETEGVLAVPPVVEEITPDKGKSIRADYVICLECGKKFKVLTKRHLATHDLTPVDYKLKWGIPKNTALVSKNLQAARREKMSSMQLWTKRKKRDVSSEG